MSSRRPARVQALGMSTDKRSQESPKALPKKRSRKSNDGDIAVKPEAAEGDGVAEAASLAEAAKPPVTPVKRRKIQSKTAGLPPVTPTPAAIGAMMSRTPISYSTSDIDDPMPSTIRPAGPHVTNAPLQASNGDSTAVPAFSNWEDSPSKSTTNGTTPQPQTAQTTSTLLADAKAHLLRVDPKLAPVIAKHHCRVFDPEGLAEEIDPFRSLASGIMAQQVSGAAASSIKNKFISLFSASETHAGPPHFPPPALVAGTEIPVLRSAGLSQRKAEYIHGLAEKFVSGELSAELLADGTDEEVIEKLVAVRGLGRWSAEMFCCFGLKRMDVFSTGDLGVQRGMAAHMGKDVAKLKAKGGGKWKYMSEQDMLEHSEKYAPYRSLFMWYMWRVEDVDVSAVQNA